jgi:hypothetical protein
MAAAAGDGSGGGGWWWRRQRGMVATAAGDGGGGGGWRRQWQQQNLCISISVALDLHIFNVYRPFNKMKWVSMSFVGHRVNYGMCHGFTVCTDMVCEIKP